ncbi:MAG: protein kinase domain-containing protein, partial [Phycisphaerae bacterium]
MGDPPLVPPNSDTDARLISAKEIFLAVCELGIAERDEAVDRACAHDAGLRDLVCALLRGQNSPLPFETLAEDIRARARDTIDSTPTDTEWRASRGKNGDGSRIKNYRLLERLGEGGFGLVYAAEQERPVRRRVALKIIKLGMDTKLVVARFEAERQALAMMDHPNIARVFDAGETSTGRPFFVMELVRGLPITEYADQNRLTINQRLLLIAQVCEALQHAHTKGVIHRDIKPSNVLVTTIGETPVPKIIDFGIAKATSTQLTEKTIFTEFRQMIGTPEYMSPEQAGEAEEGIDTRTDVYAVGILLYELLTGATPLDSKRLRSAAYGEMQRIIREEEPPKPSTRFRQRANSAAEIAGKRGLPQARLVGVLRGELDWIVMKAIEKDRARRYQTASAMAVELKRFLSGFAIEAAPPGAAYRARKFMHRNKWAVTAGALLALALVVGLAGTSWGFLRAERQRQVAVAERNRADCNAYSANLMSASAAIENVQFNLARSFLDDAPERLRGWEWRVFDARLDTSIQSLPTPGQLPKLESDWRGPELLADADGWSCLIWRDGVAQRWSLQTGRLIRTYVPHAGPTARDSHTPSAMAVSADARLLSTATLVSGSNPPVAHAATWDIRTGEQIRGVDVTLPAHPEFGMAISADCARLH